jgi:hypothetical protein
MQQGGEPGLGGTSGRRVHPRKMRQQGDPALRPALGPLARVPLGPAPSLGASRFLRRRHRYYEPVRLPTSARMTAPAAPRRPPPPETNPTDPVGPLMFRCSPFVREAAFDPGGASPSRISTVHMLPSCLGNTLGLRDLPPFEAQSRTPHDPCLHFGPRVAATPARLGPDLPAMALV